METNKVKGVSVCAPEQYLEFGGQEMSAVNSIMIGGEIFINRTKELDVVREVLTSVRQPELRIKRPILEFWGMGGIGKSFLLLEIIELCKQQKLNFIFLDFDQRADEPITNFISDIIRQCPIDESQRNNLDEFEKRLAHYSNQLIPFKMLEDIFLLLLKSILKKQPLILLFDSLEVILENQKILDWFLNFIDQLIDQGKVAVIFTSKRLVNFIERITINRRLYDYQLEPFNLADAKRQFVRLKEKDQLQLPVEVSDQVFEISAGHPLINKFLINIADSKAIKPDNFKESLPELLDALDIVFDRWILKDITDSEKLKYKAILTTMSIPRQFNLRIMEKLIHQYNPDFAPVGSLAYIPLVNEVRTKTSLIDWYAFKNAYAVGATIRKILNYRFKFNFPNEYTKINATMIDIYRDWIERVSGSDRSRYLLELLYHTAIVAETPDQTVALFADHLQCHFSGADQVDDLNQLKEQLNRDAELAEQSGQANFDQMLKLVEHHIGG